MGGREKGNSTVDEEGYLLPLKIYAWADITDLNRNETDPPSTAERTKPN
jgi:hypothetical protein